MYMPSPFLDRVAKSILGRALKEGLNKIFGKEKERPKEKTESPQPQPQPQPQPSEPEELKSHPWRLCPMGQHWVREHELTVPPSAKGPEYETLRGGFCRKNPNGREHYVAEEFREIARRHFGSLTSAADAMPVPDALTFADGNKYDSSIAGWTKFWNETLQPDAPLAPDLVKALIATESGFKVGPDTRSKAGAARGLLQITEKSRKILRNPKGELHNHLIDITAEESRDPEVNIAAGIRWLHYKRDLLAHRLKRKVTWEEGIAEYKGIFRDLGKDEKSDEIMRDIRKYHKLLQDQRKQKKS
jgi:hypothetical protein